VRSISENCPELIEIGFRIDDQVGSLPIDALFETLSNLSGLHLTFEVPQLLTCKNTDPVEDTEAPFKPKMLISKQTYARIRKFVCTFGYERTFRQWVDVPTLIQYATHLEHLEIRRKMKFQTLAAARAINRFQSFQDSSYNPMHELKPKFDADMHFMQTTCEATQIRTLIIKDYFCVHFINQLVKFNPNLTNLTLYRKQFVQELYLCDTLRLQNIDVKFNSKATLFLGQNLSLKSITTNCQLDLASPIPNLVAVTYKKGYRPSREESYKLL
jgi:hypothetical protein